jgi:hypothetical protein
MKLYEKYEHYAKFYHRMGRLPPNFVDFCASKIRATYLAYKGQQLDLIREKVKLRKSMESHKKHDSSFKSPLDHDYGIYLHHNMDLEDEEDGSDKSIILVGDHPDGYVPPPTRMHRKDSLVRHVDEFLRFQSPENATIKKMNSVIKIQRWYQGIIVRG